MIFKFLGDACERQFIETELLLDQLTDNNLFNEPVVTDKQLGEIVLHIIRSLEFYSRGLAEVTWEPLSYNIEIYNNAQKIKTLYKDVINKVREYLNIIKKEANEDKVLSFNRQATRSEILLEMIEHSIQQRGQILVYYRLLDIEPVKIPYII